MFTPIRDLNLEILHKVKDRTLLRIILTNRYAKELIEKESF
jgi:hypothetical protein